MLGPGLLCKEGWRLGQNMLITFFQLSDVSDQSDQCYRPDQVLMGIFTVLYAWRFSALTIHKVVDESLLYFGVPDLLFWGI